MAIYPISRVGDALSSGGMILDSLAPTVIVNTAQVATVGSATFCPLPFHGMGVIVSSLAQRVLAGSMGVPVATIGSAVSCGCTVAQGSTDTYAGA